MNNCKNCSNAIFNQLWGEYRCDANDRTCTRSELTEGCPYWKEKTNEKRNEKGNTEH